MAHESQGSIKSPFPNSADPVMPAPGTRPEYTPLKDHYKVFIRTEPTVIDGATWSLPIMGLVDNPVSLTIDDIRNNYEPREQYVTLSCISGRVGTDLISTTQWTGARVQEILADVKPQAEAGYLHITSGDGFYETVDLNLIASDERIMLCYAWDGNPIPVDHGFPLRIWLPDRFGMKQPQVDHRHRGDRGEQAGLLGRERLGRRGPGQGHFRHRYGGGGRGLRERGSNADTHRRDCVRRRPPGYPRSRSEITEGRGRRPG